MDPRIIRFGVIAVVVVLAIGGKLASGHRATAAQSGPQHELTPQVRAAGLTFAPGVAPGDQQWIQAAIASVRPEAKTLIDAVDGLVVISTPNMPGAPWEGLAQEGTDQIQLNVGYLDGERKQDRTIAVIHELGHIVDFELIPDDQMQQMANEVPTTGGACMTPESGDCTAPEERFAETFAKWALRGSVSSVAGYGVMAPGSLESWGEPLGLLAAKLTVNG
jgi:hypothetical protein